MNIVRYAFSAIFRRMPIDVRSSGREYRDARRLKHADIAFVSFPKSGRTFVRAMLARLFQRKFGIDERELLEFATLHAAAPEVPRLLFTHDNDAMRRPHQIRIAKWRYEGRKVVLLARHPADVAVSRYHHLKYRSRDPARRRLAEQPLERFVWTERGGIPSIVTYMNAWAQFARERGDMLIVRYEDFVDRPEPTLKRLADFLGLGSADVDISDAVEFARLENLRAREREGYYQSDRLRPASAEEESSYKVRSGRKNGYRSRFEPDEVGRIEAYVDEQLDPSFGYASDGRTSAG